LHKPANRGYTTPIKPGWSPITAGWREAVFSSTGFRIRATQSQAANHGFARWVEQAAAAVFFTFFPADCRICGSPLIEVSRLPVCKSCLGELRPLEGSFCSVCGEALVSPLFDGRPDVLCGLCQRAHPSFERAVAYGSYEGGLRDLIHLLKFGQVRPAAKVLGRMLAETIAALDPSLPSGPVTVVPVPLHRVKRAQRGFNQAEMIAKAALKNLGLPERFDLCAGVLVRQRETKSQIGLTRHQRRENLRGAFAVTDPTRTAGKNIVLVDDVFTTGTTASECARVLRRSGAARVFVVTVARTLKINAALAVPEGLREGESENRHLVAVQN
jgi:ComF family protein